MKKILSRAAITAATLAMVSVGAIAPASAASSIGGSALPPISIPIPGGTGVIPGNTGDNADRTVVVDGVALTPKEAKVLEITNNYRAANGAPRLRVDQQLMNQSRAWSNTQFTQGRMYHSNDNVYENVAKTYDQSPESVFELWRNSPGHNKNMLTRDVSKIGFAVSPVGADGYSYATMQLIW